MTISDTIIEHKKVEILKRKRKRRIQDLEEFELYNRSPLKICREVSDTGPGIIAEFKRRSPSRGTINEEANPVIVSKGYINAGAAAVSILTDRDFFGGSFHDLESVKKENPEICLLRKDFILDPYQVHESKAYGADIILLIAALLSPEAVRDLSFLAFSLGLQVLFEVHDRGDIDKYAEGIDLVGVNNRNLRDFTVDIRHSLELIDHLPDGVLTVSESGIKGKEEIDVLFNRGFKFFLIGETFMKESDPGEACKLFIQSI
ncbi:MAG TPA: indole-3-glycerol phosphate synthase TrpC [Bacteroidaceae bacterium]|nr:indole-3-glycerol phosphate synthase TrpC [Bacteroidaceae bacterium]